MIISSKEAEENDTPGVGHKTDQNVLKATKAKSRTGPDANNFVEAVEDIPTDDEEAVEAISMPKRGGLKRSYAMLDIVSLDTSGDDDPADPEFEAPSEWEEATSTGIVELNDDDTTPKKKAVVKPLREASAGMVELYDDDETPKKKKKVGKPPVREAIKEKRGQPPVGKKEVSSLIMYQLIIN